MFPYVTIKIATRYSSFCLYKGSGCIRCNFVSIPSSHRGNREADEEAAPKEVKCFHEEASIFATLLCSFHERVHGTGESLDAKHKSKTAKLVVRITDQCRFICGRVYTLVRKFADIHGSHDTSLATLWARVQWAIQKPDLEAMRLLMNSAKATVTLLLQLFTLDEVGPTCNYDPVAKRCSVVWLDQLKNMTEAAKQARKELKDYKEKWFILEDSTSEECDIMASTTREIEKFVVNTIKSQRRAQESRQIPRDRRPPRHPSPPLSLDENTAEMAVVPLVVSTHDDRERGQGLTLARPSEVPRSNNQRPLSVGEYPSTPPRRRRCRHEVFGMRLRDDGTQVSEGYGEWPHDVHGSKTSFTDSVGNTDVERQAGRRAHFSAEKDRQSKEHQSGGDAVLDGAGAAEDESKVMPQPLSPLVEDEGKHIPILGKDIQAASRTIHGRAVAGLTTEAQGHMYPWLHSAATAAEDDHEDHALPHPWSSIYA
ncbi:uncharacterized protein BCR38DRAFT_406614 [Pseudomassariella vexata]|uniref:Uncharacterized protein n=1 Tax=Pseudomassariella vexata TaxID=1141098 RepID=A0A1Y2EAW4_9PEZI|nr:uncharacterized protein BCR38DRAFT_406614 [Pseudomassariella vexata]ORY68710.1 hypothetical protein BCR38DRAFT_406614 [Pseudomassariella vexata]